MCSLSYWNDVARGIGPPAPRLDLKPPMNADANAALWRTIRIVTGVAALPLSGVTLLLLKNLTRATDAGASSGSAQEFHPFWIAAVVMAPATLASLCWCFALQGQVSAVRRVLTCSVIGGLAVSAASFLAGFVGPMIFAPANNMGPLYGLITGSAGFVAGTAAGTIYGWLRRPVSG